MDRSTQNTTGKAVHSVALVIVRELLEISFERCPFRREPFRVTGLAGELECRCRSCEFFIRRKIVPRNKTTPDCTSLKHLGHGFGNITRAFENLKAMKPALIVQTRRDGSSPQARKKFKVTSER